MDLLKFAQQIASDQASIPELKNSSDETLYDACAQLSIHHTELAIVMEELLLNAREHGQKSPRLFLGTKNGHLYFAVSDLGTGIHDMLPKNPKLSDIRGKATAALLRLACEEGITGTATAGRGVGLFLLARYCAKNSAEALLWANGGILHINGQQFHELLGPTSIDGTLVCLKTRHPS